MDVLLSELHLPSFSRPTASLVFGIVISFSSGALLLLALGTQAWAVRQEVVLMRAESLQAELESRMGRRGSAGQWKGDGGEEESKGTDADFGKVQINIPVEVPALRIDDVPDQETFYNEKLDELYTTRLEEMYKNAETFGMPRESSLKAISYSKLKSVLSEENYVNETLSEEKSVTLLNFKTRLKRHKKYSVSKGKKTANDDEILGIYLQKNKFTGNPHFIHNLRNWTLDINIYHDNSLANHQETDESGYINNNNLSNDKYRSDNQSAARNKSSYSYSNSTSKIKGKGAIVFGKELKSKNVSYSGPSMKNTTSKSLEEGMYEHQKKIIITEKLHRLSGLGSQGVNHPNGELNVNRFIHRPRVSQHSVLPNASIAMPGGMEMPAEDTEEETQKDSRSSEKLEIIAQTNQKSSHDPSPLHPNPRPLHYDTRPFHYEPTLHHDTRPLHYDTSSFRYEPSPHLHDRSPLYHDTSQLYPDTSQLYRDSSKVHHDPNSILYDPSQLHANISPLHPDSSLRYEDSSRSPPDSDAVHYQKRSTATVIHSSPLVLQFSVCLWRVCVNVVAPTTVNVSQFCCSVFARLSPPTTPRGFKSSPLRELPPLMALTPALETATLSLLHTLRCSCCVVAIAALVMVLATSLSVRSFVMARHCLGEHPCIKEDPLVTVGSHFHPALPPHSSLAPKPRVDEAECVETASSAGVPLSRQQLLPVASALFAVAGIMMGGGVFHFCSAVTEKPVTSMPHPAHFSSSAANPSAYDRNYSSYQPGAMLRWPLLMAANSVIGCFLAALATGYAFFSTWDTQVLTFFNKGDSSDELIGCNQSSYDGIELEGKTQSLCERCKKGKEFIMFRSVGAPHGLSNSAPGFNQRCQMECCCSSNSTVVNCKPCGGSSSQASSSGSSHGCTYAEYPKDKLHLQNIKRDCVQCLWEHNIQCCKEGPESQSVTLNKPVITASYEMEAFRPKVGSHRVDARYVGSKQCLGHSDLVLKHEEEQTDLASEQFSSSSDDKLRDKNVSQYNETEMGICDDPICQRQQLSRHKTSLPLDSVIFEPSTQQRSQHSQLEMQSRNLSQFDYFYNKTASKSDLSSDFFNRRDHFHSSKNNLPQAINGTEHLYSNYFIQNTNPIPFSPDFDHSDKKISSYSTKPVKSRQQSVSDGCSYCTHDQIALTNGSESGNRKFDEVLVKSCTTKETAFQQSYQMQPMSLTSNHHFRQPYANTRAYSNSYSTLPANFSLKDSFSLSDTNEDFISRRREYKSCLNINENRFSSLDLRGSSVDAHRYSNYSLRNSSVPSLHGRMEDFERRKTTKSVKFITPDDEEVDDADDNEEDEADGGDDDSDYYVKKPLRSSIKKFRRDFLPPEGSSPKLEGFGNGSPHFR